MLFCVESLLNSEAALVCVFAKKRQYFYAYYIMTVNSSSRGQSHGAFARVLFVLVLFVCFRASSAQQSFNKRFIRRDGASFSFFSSSGGGLEREERFLALGANAFALLYEENGREEGQQMVDRVLDGAKTSGANVLRVWAFLDGDRKDFDGRALQKDVGVFEEENFQGLDRLLRKCEKRGIRLLLTLTNFWEDYGGVKQYCDWFGVKEKSEFFRDVRIKEAYKRYVRYVAERYKDDESVFAFQLINEPRMEAGGGENEMVRDAIMSEWCQEMIQAFREVNMNHMLSLGSEGFYSSSSSFTNSANVNPFSDAGNWGVDFIKHSVGFDFLTVHLWVDDWLSDASEEEKLRFTDQWVRQHIRDAEALGLPILFEEFGKKKPISVRASYYERVYELATEATVAMIQREGGVFEQRTSLSPSAGGILFWHLGSLLKKQYDEDGYCVFVEDKEHEPILNIVKVYHDKIEAILKAATMSNVFVPPPFIPPFIPEMPPSFVPPFVKKKEECDEIETNARYDIAPFMRYNDVDNPEECCRLCHDSAPDGQDYPDKKTCEAFAHDSARTSCYVGEVKDPSNPKKTVGQTPGVNNNPGWTSGFSSHYRFIANPNIAPPLYSSPLPPPPPPRKPPELVAVSSRSTEHVITAVMEFSEKIDNFSYYLGAVYIDNDKAFVQSVTSSSRVFFATVKRVRTVGVDAPFGPIQRRLSFAYKGFPSVLFYA